MRPLPHLIGGPAHPLRKSSRPNFGVPFTMKRRTQTSWPAGRALGFTSRTEEVMVAVGFSPRIMSQSHSRRGAMTEGAIPAQEAFMLHFEMGWPQRTQTGTGRSHCRQGGGAKRIASKQSANLPVPSLRCFALFAASFRIQVQASRRDALPFLAHRGLKPTATFRWSLRDRTPPAFLHDRRFSRKVFSLRA